MGFWLVAAWLFLICLLIWLLNHGDNLKLMHLQIDKLQERIRFLEQKLGISPAPESKTPAKAIKEIKITEPIPAKTVAPEPPPRAKSSQPQVSRPPASGRATTKASIPARTSKLSKANLVMWSGIIILFFGVAFLIKYASQHYTIPLSLRLSGIALGGVGLTAVGWILRRRRRPQALMLQGAGVGVIYMTVFAAAKLFALMSPILALAIMVALVVLVGTLAVLQDAPLLAAMGIIGGFLAPILTGDKSGNHVILFSYFTVLNLGILGIAWFKSWRLLNYIGFFFTFVIAAFWGHSAYKPEFFATTEPFLVAFFFFFLAIALLYAAKPPKGKSAGYVDGPLLFGLPIAFSLLQGALVHDWRYGLALTSLSLSAVYGGLALLLWRRYGQVWRLWIESCLALAVVFGTLTIPLAMDQQTTSAIWAVEGAALIWIGIRQNSVLTRLFGALLQMVAAVFFVLAVPELTEVRPVLNWFCLGGVEIALSSFFSVWVLRKHETRLNADERFFVPFLIFTLGVTAWFGCGITELLRWLPDLLNQSHFSLLFVSSSMLVMAWLGRRPAWRDFGNFAACLLFALVFYLLFLGLPTEKWRAFFGFFDIKTMFDSGSTDHYLTRWGWLAWPFSFIAQYFILFFFSKIWNKNLRRFWFIATFWLGVIFLMRESAWIAGQVAELGGLWAFMAMAAVPAVLGLALVEIGRKAGTRASEILHAHLGYGLAPLALFLVWWEVQALNMPGVSWPGRYLPLLNALDLTQAVVFISILAMAWQVRHRGVWLLSQMPRRVFWYIWGSCTFAWVTVMILRSVHHWSMIPYDLERAFPKAVFQTGVSIVWTLTALGFMFSATRKRHRELWLVGAVLLVFVVGKLFLIDLSGSQALTRIISFLGVGLLMLVIGYWSPLPPSRRKEKIRG